MGKKQAFVIYLVTVFLLLAPSAAWSTQALTDEINILRERLEKLEQKLAESEKARAAASPEDPSIAEELETLKDKITNNPVRLGGAVRFGYAYTDYEDRFDLSRRDRGGELDFNLFRLNIDAEMEKLILSAEYRWYSYMEAIHHGYVGYRFTDTTEVQMGITQVPFGLLPYASNNFWFGIGYYIGLEDDYDLGIKSIHRWGPWDLQLAFFKNAEWGNAGKTERYSFDVVKGCEGQQNEENNQVNARLAYTFDHGDLGKTEVGVSGQWSQLYNDATEKNGDHWAAAAHLRGCYGPWTLMLEAAGYEYNPENPAGVSDKTIEIGAFADSFLVASKAMLYIANLSYSLPVDWGPISNLTFYDDYSLLAKDEDGFTDSQINTVGCLVTAGPIYTYIDFIFGKNALYVGGPRDAFGAGDQVGPYGEDDDWHLRFNLNVGYYF